MRSRTVAVCVLVALTPATALAKPQSNASRPMSIPAYYRALGDSLARGAQPNAAVARICQWTWMCAPKPQGPNIHANELGYQTIAATFEKVL